MTKRQQARKAKDRRHNRPQIAIVAQAQGVPAVARKPRLSGMQAIGILAVVGLFDVLAYIYVM
jgi:hypothetical protein